MPFSISSAMMDKTASQKIARGTKRKAAQDIDGLHRIKRRKVSLDGEANCEFTSVKRKAEEDADEPRMMKRSKMALEQDANGAPPTASSERIQAQKTDLPSLMTIPPEIRNTIYSYAIVSDQPISISDQQSPQVEPALLLVNKAIRSEAIGIFYHSNTFTSSSTSAVGAFLKTLSKGNGKPKQNPAQNETPLPCTPNRLSFLRDISVPFPNKMSKGPSPREIPRSMRENRRCLTAFDRDFGRKGLKQGMFSIAMTVFDEVVHANSKTVDQYRTIVTKGRRMGVGVIIPKPT